VPGLSDASHAETCAGRWCNVMDTRATMHRVAGRRGWWCDRCYATMTRLARNMESLEPDRLEEIKKKLRAL
jgi:hypothetical protein